MESKSSIWIKVRRILFLALVFCLFLPLAAFAAESRSTVEQAQKALQDRGFDPGPVDGVFGSRTRSAIESFQRSKGMEETGRLDQNTLLQLGVAPTEDAGLQEQAAGEVGILAPFDTGEIERHLKLSKDPSQSSKGCSKYEPDYRSYHSIGHIRDMSKLFVKGEAKRTPLFRVINSGKDQKSKQQRRVDLVFSGQVPLFGSMASVQMVSRLGQPGTRITFEGSERAPFTPVDQLHLWQGGIDIDPRCGVMIDPGTKWILIGH